MAFGENPRSQETPKRSQEAPKNTQDFSKLQTIFETIKEEEKNDPDNKDQKKIDQYFDNLLDTPGKEKPEQNITQPTQLGTQNNLEANKTGGKLPDNLKNLPTYQSINILKSHNNLTFDQARILFFNIGRIEDLNILKKEGIIAKYPDAGYDVLGAKLESSAKIQDAINIYVEGLSYVKTTKIKNFFLRKMKYLYKNYIHPHEFNNNKKTVLNNKRFKDLIQKVIKAPKGEPRINIFITELNQGNTPIEKSTLIKMLINNIPKNYGLPTKKS